MTCVATHIVLMADTDIARTSYTRGTTRDPEIWTSGRIPSTIYSLPIDISFPMKLKMEKLNL